MQPIESQIKNIEVCISAYISCAYEDYELRNKLEKHLTALMYSGSLTIYRETLAGENREEHLITHLNKAHLILLLTSHHFIASKYHWETEVQVALEQHNTGKARVIPILLRPVELEGTPLEQLKALPRGDKPITEWDDENAAFADVARDIRKVTEDLQNKLYREAQKGKSRKSKHSPPPDSIDPEDPTKPSKESLKHLWERFFLKLSEDSQPILLETIIFIFIFGAILAILRAAGLALGAFKIPVVEVLFTAVGIASVAVTTIVFLVMLMVLMFRRLIIFFKKKDN